MEVSEFHTAANNTSAGTFDMWDGLHTCLHLKVGPAQHFWEGYSVKAPYLHHHKSVRHEQSLAWMGTPLMWSLWWIFGWGK